MTSVADRCASERLEQHRDELALVGIERHMDVRLAAAPEIRIDDGLADRQLAFRLDIDVKVMCRDDTRIDE